MTSKQHQIKTFFIIFHFNLTFSIKDHSGVFNLVIYLIPIRLTWLCPMSNKTLKHNFEVAIVNILVEPKQLLAI